MDRPKRATKAPILFVAGLKNPKNEVAEPVNKRQPKNLTQQPAEQRKVSERIATKTPSAPAKTKKNRRQNIKFRFA